jgi:hypothetical protein
MVIFVESFAISTRHRPANRYPMIGHQPKISPSPGQSFVGKNQNSPIFAIPKICGFCKASRLGLALGSEVGLVVQLVRMPPCHGGGRGFESRPVR